MIQHWILNIAIESRRKLSAFIPVVNELHLNVPGVPEATPSDYAFAFVRLLDTGLVQVSPIEDSVDQATVGRATVEAVLEKRLQLHEETGDICPGTGGLRLLSRPPDLRWGITTCGGNAWEKLAEPDWNRYVKTLTDWESGEIWSASHDLLMAALGWYGELNDVMVDRQSIRIEAVQNHPIVYWKVLPLVYHATFSCTPSESDRTPTDQPAWFREWWRSLDQWYTKPWELSGWPTSDKA